MVSPGATVIQGRSRGFFGRTFQAMSDWGDEFERRHFEGDLKGALTRAPQKVKAASTNTLRAMSDWGDDFERRHFDGDLVGTLVKAPQMAGAALDSALETVDTSLEWLVPPPVPEAVPGLPPGPASGPPAAAAAPAWAPAASAERPWEALQRQQEQQRRRRGRGAPEDAAAAPALWAAVERLRGELAEERERRRGRAAALESLAEALRAPRADLAEERRLSAAAEERRSTADRRAYASERELAQLQERHHALLSRRATHDAELRRHAAAAAAAEVAAVQDERVREAEGPRAWARAGPEMEALKEAKLELAQVLCLLDEARMHRRRELHTLNKQISDLASANKRFWLAADGYVAPDGSIRKSLRQLLTVAMG